MQKCNSFSDARNDDFKPPGLKTFRLRQADFRDIGSGIDDNRFVLGVLDRIDGIDGHLRGPCAPAVGVGGTTPEVAFGGLSFAHGLGAERAGGGFGICALGVAGLETFGL